MSIISQRSRSAGPVSGDGELRQEKNAFLKFQLDLFSNWREKKELVVQILQIYRLPYKGKFTGYAPRLFANCGGDYEYFRT